MMLHDVITKYQRVANRMPTTMRTIHATAYADFTANLRRVGLDALRANVNAQDGDAAERFMETFASENSGKVMRFTLKASSGEVVAEISDELVRLWVEAGATGRPTDNTEGKVFDGRDDAGDVEDVVRRMQGILIYAKNAKGDQVAARDKYLPYIRSFLATGGISQEKIANWSAIVLRAWLNYVRAVWPEITRGQLKALLAGA